MTSADRTAPRSTPLTPEEEAYARFHAPRYAILLELLASHVAPASRILDIGRSTLTARLHERFGVTVDSLGFDAEGPTLTGRHYQYDLNATQHRAQWRSDMAPYDVVVLAEVIEHLYTSPTHVLAFLRTLLKPSGILVVQTPNAVSLPKRLKLLAGIQPYERIREDNSNPGHFREYSGPELRAYARGTGFDVLHFGYYNYFDTREVDHLKRGRPRLFESVKYHTLSLLPGPLKPGMTAVLRPRQNS